MIGAEPVLGAGRRQERVGGVDRAGAAEQTRGEQQHEDDDDQDDDRDGTDRGDG